jgi:hypothetical protein
LCANSKGSDFDARIRIALFRIHNQIRLLLEKQPFLVVIEKTTIFSCYFDLFFVPLYPDLGTMFISV